LENKKDSSFKEQEVLGLIAGSGRLPFLVAEGAKNAGIKVICVGLLDSAEAALAEKVDEFFDVAIARPGSWIRKLKKYGVTKTIMVGRVQKGKLFTPYRILHYLPDWRAFRVYYWRLHNKPKLNDSLLSALADELKTGGIELEDSTMYCKEHLANSGVMTNVSKNPISQSELEFGWNMAKKLGELDIGQAIAVKEKEILAVEAIEGTAAMIERAGKYCKAGGWTLFKVSKPQQDMRFDVPCVGPDTIKSLAENKAKCLVIEAEKTIIIDKPETIELANKLGISIIGHRL